MTVSEPTGDVGRCGRVPLQVSECPVDTPLVETSSRSIKRLVRALGGLGRDARGFGRTLGSGSADVGNLMIVGTPTYEPWHFTAHLADEATRRSRPDLSPTLLRWQIPPGAPAHLSVSVDEVTRASRTSTVLVIPDLEDPELLERIADAHRRGARVMAMERTETRLAAYSHEYLMIDGQHSDREYDMCQHIVTAVAPVG